jgi:hypothetical protein
MGQYRSEWHDILKGTVYSGMDMPSLMGAKVLSNIAWLISPKLIWIHILMKYSLLELHNIIGCGFSTEFA